MAEMLELTDDMERFVNWLVLTHDMRKELGLPLTGNEWAEQNNYAVRTLTKWKRNDAFKARYDELLDEMVGDPERLHALYDKMFELAIGGSVKHAELLLKLSGKIIQGQKVEVKVDNRTVELMSDSELQAEIARYASGVLEERHERIALSAAS